MFSLQSGQVFRLPPDKISRDTVQKILKTLSDAASSVKDPPVSKEERQQIHEQLKGLPPGKILEQICQAFGIGRSGLSEAGPTGGSITRLTNRLGSQIEDFIPNPTRESYRSFLQEMPQEEKRALSILNRVARLQ